MQTVRPAVTLEDWRKGLLHYHIVFPIVVFVFMLVWIFNPAELWEEEYD